jgi:hypothetical protein
VAQLAPQYPYTAMTGGRAIVLAAVLLLPPDAAAQGLGQAAQRAAERRGGPEGARLLTERDVAGPRAWELSVRGLELYRSVRDDLGSLRRSRAALDTRLLDASRGVSRLGELAPALQKEPLVMAVLRKYGLTPAEYLRMDQAVLIANRWWTSALPEELQRSQVHMANVRFLRDHPQVVRTFRLRDGARQWNDTERFVRHF